MKHHLTPISILTTLQSTAEGIAQKKGSPMDGESVRVAAYRKGFKITWKNDSILEII
jgi:hypothetical protein